jgi:uncharacterized oligopeptide transporter (OPT) family protein
VTVPRDDISVSADDVSSLGEGPPTSAIEEVDRSDWDWLRNVYQGDKMPQLTLRTIISGMLIGGLMSISNLYVGLKMGWGFGVTITSCIIAFAVFKTLETIVPAYRRRPFNILEDCTMTTCASAAGSLSTGALISAIPALYLTTGHPMIWWQMMIWVGSIALLGVCMAIPLKRQLINVDKLPFPSGTATATTLRTLHSTGGDAIVQAKTLFGCALFAALLNIWVDAWRPICEWAGEKLKNVDMGKSLGEWAFPDTFPLFPGDFGRRLMTHQTISFEGSTIFMAAGALMGIRVGWSLFIGAIVFFGILPPILESEGVIHMNPKEAFKSISAGWALWPAVAMMVTSGLTAFALRWKTIARSFGELTAIFGIKKEQTDPLAQVEAPLWWFLVGTLVSGAACVVSGYFFFEIAWWMGIIAVVLTFVLAIIAARATGETDFTPIGAMGKITQLTYGLLAPSNTTINLSTASITGAGACHSADLLVSMKAGYLVGANPRRQALSQFFGVIAGVLVCIPVYSIIVRMPVFDPAAEKAAAAPIAATEVGETVRSKAEAKPTEPAADASTKTNLCTAEFPAPSAVIWKSVAELLTEGFSKLPRYSVLAMIIAGVLGIAIALAEEYMPRHWAKWLPSATGLGIAGVIQAHQSIALFLGALIAWTWMKAHRPSGDRYIVAGSSGLIAGESLMGVTLKLWEGGPVIVKGIWHSLFG